MRTVRWRLHDGQPSRQPVNADIDETADSSAKQESEQNDEPMRHQLTPFRHCCLSSIIFSSVVPLPFVSVALSSVVLQIAPPLILRAKFLSRRTIL
jgi:hypothetical protein